MAASVSTIGYGGTLEWSTDGGTTWTAVGEFKSAGLPVNSVEKVDRTHMSSPDRTREYTLGLGEPQDVEFVFNFNSTDYAALYALQEARNVVDWRHTLATEDGTTTGAIYEYSGGVNVGSGDVNVEGITEVTCTIQRTGTYTFTEAAA
jgi:hypothetical protein